MRSDDIEAYKASQAEADDAQTKNMPALLTPTKQPEATNDTNTQNAFGVNGTNAAKPLSSNGSHIPAAQNNKSISCHQVKIDMLSEKSKPPKKRLASYYAEYNLLKNGITEKSNEAYNCASDNVSKLKEEVAKRPILTANGDIKKPQMPHDMTPCTSKEVAPISVSTTSIPSIGFCEKPSAFQVTPSVENIDQVTSDPYLFDTENEGTPILFALSSKVKKKKRRLKDTNGDTKKHFSSRRSKNSSKSTQPTDPLLPTAVTESFQPVTIATSKAFKRATIATANVRSFVDDGYSSVLPSNGDKKEFFCGSNPPFVEFPVSTYAHAFFESQEHNVDDGLMPKIVSCYSLKPGPKNKEKVNNQSNRKKKDRAKLQNKVLVSGNTAHSGATVPEPQMKVDSDSLTSHAVSNVTTSAKHFRKFLETKHSGTSLSSLESWFKSTQGSALKMQVVQSDPMHSKQENHSQNADVVKIPKPLANFDPKNVHSEAFVRFFPDPATSFTITYDASHKPDPKYDKVSLKSRDDRVLPVSEIDAAKDSKNAEPRKDGLYPISGGPISRASSTSQDASLNYVANFQYHDAAIASSSGCDSSIFSPFYNSTTTTSEPLKIARKKHRRPSTAPLDYSIETLNKKYKSKKKGQVIPLDLSTSWTHSPLHLRKAFDEQLDKQITEKNDGSKEWHGVTSSVVQSETNIANHTDKRISFKAQDPFDKFCTKTALFVNDSACRATVTTTTIHTVIQEEIKEQQTEDVSTIGVSVVSNNSPRDANKKAGGSSFNNTCHVKEIQEERTRSDKVEIDQMHHPTSTVNDSTAVGPEPENDSVGENADDPTEDATRDADFVEEANDVNELLDEQAHEDDMKEFENEPSSRVDEDVFKDVKESDDKKTYSKSHIAIMKNSPYVLLHRLKEIPTVAAQLKNSNSTQPTENTVVRKIGYKPRLSRLDSFLMEESCCDEYDNMHFNDEVEAEEDERSAFEDEESSNEANDFSGNNVIHVLSEVPLNDENIPPSQDDKIRKKNLQAPKKSKIAKKKGLYDNIPTIKEEIVDEASSLKRKNLSKLGYNAQNGVKLPETAKKRRRLVAKDVRHVRSLASSKRIRIMFSDSEDSSEESNELFKTTKLKAKYNNKNGEKYDVESDEDSEIFKTMKMNNKHSDKDVESHNESRIAKAAVSRNCSPQRHIKNRTDFPVPKASKSTPAINHSALSEIPSDTVTKGSLITALVPSENDSSKAFFKSTVHSPSSTTLKHTTDISDSDIDVSLRDIVNEIVSSKSLVENFTKEVFNENSMEKTGNSTNSVIGKSGARVRMGVWTAKSFPVITKLPNQRLPYYKKSRTPKRDYYHDMCLAMEELQILNAFQGQELEEDGPTDPVLTDSTSQASANENVCRIYVKGLIDLTPCYVRLESLNI